MNKQNPFSIYDFLGYLIPGGLLFNSIYICIQLNYYNQLNANILFEKYAKINIGEGFIFIIIFYSLGHLQSFMSSLTVETYSNRLYGYPSKYLLNLKKEKNEITIKSSFLITILLPIICFDFLLGNVLKLKDKISKPLDPFLIDAVIHKFKFLLKKLDLLEIDPSVNLESKNFNFDFHRIITHYTYETSKQHQGRMTNYVALYGFLRNLALLFNLITWAYLYLILKSINFKHHFAPEKFILLLLFMFVSYIRA